MFKISLLTSFVLFCLPFDSFAQLKQANDYYKNFEYAKAIPGYEKMEEKTKHHKKEVAEKLANSYRMTNNYQNAEEKYDKLLTMKNINPVNHLYYGEILKSNKKSNEAKEQYAIYAEKVPKDERAKREINSLIMTRLWMVKPQTYVVYNVNSLNTPISDFCAVPYRDGLVFVSERRKDFINDNTFGWTNKPYVSVYFSQIKKDGGEPEYKKPELISSKINNDFHNGPVSFNPAQNVMYFTRIDNVYDPKTKAKVNRPKIYFSKLEKEKWSMPQSFFLNCENCSFMHPSVSADGQYLFFSSDMPGGFGGMDLYMCKREGNTWSNFKNLGGQVNTSGNEIFPYSAEDETLYFSSDGHIGFGGLDIFSARQISKKWTSVNNMQMPINSPKDDFGFVFTVSNKKGFISSNREGGKGDDDIYEFRSKIAEEKITTLWGKIMLNKLDAAANTKIKLINSKGIVVQTATTDAFGGFVFQNLNPDETYIVEFTNDDTALNLLGKSSEAYGRLIYNDGSPAVNAKIVVKNKEQEVVQELSADANGYFDFQPLDADHIGMSDMDATDVLFSVSKAVSLIGRVQVGENFSEIVAGMEVVLADSEGNTINKTNTNVNGMFRFSNLPKDLNFVILIDDSHPLIAQSKQNRVYGKLLFNDKDNEPVKASNISLGGVKGAVLKSMKTDSEGYFRFDNANYDFNKLAAYNPEKSNYKTSVKEGMFIESLYYDLGKFDLKASASAELDKVVVLLKNYPSLLIELNSHTDSRADANFNLQLSQKRADVAVAYIISKGGDAERIIGHGFGETELTNKCRDFVTCTEEEHQQNRRTEIRVTRQRAQL
jgi:outer membrane protein OmpA-like peptidoglycan-associated protein/tetratricopeptide (TPR) repeat protein